MHRGSASPQAMLLFQPCTHLGSCSLLSGLCLDCCAGSLDRCLAALLVALGLDLCGGGIHCCLAALLIVLGLDLGARGVDIDALRHKQNEKQSTFEFGVCLREGEHVQRRQL